MNLLRLTYEPDDDRHGELHAGVEAFGFAGASSAWFTRDQLLAFAQALTKFPIESATLAILSGGVFGPGGKLEEEHLKLRIAPGTATGLLLIESELLAEPHFRTGYQRQQCHLRFFVGPGIRRPVSRRFRRDPSQWRAGGIARTGSLTI